MVNIFSFFRGSKRKRFDIILLRLILILLPVFGRRQPRVFLKNVTEIMRVVVARIVRDLRTLAVGGA